jgi:hypothetical protein
VKQEANTYIKNKTKKKKEKETWGQIPLVVVISWPQFFFFFFFEVIEHVLR